MKKNIIVVTILLIIIGIFFAQNTVFAEQQKVAIDNETESKIVEIKEDALNSIEDYKEKYRFRHLWNSSLYFEYSSYL